MEDLLSTALAHHHRGQLADAARLYGAVLAADPEQPDALHLLGVLAQQRGRPEEAAQLIARAIARRPDVAGFHLNLAGVLAGLARYDESLASYARAARLDPSLAEAQRGAGWVRHELGHFPEAEAHYREALRLQPDLAAAHVGLGVIREEQGDPQEAQRCWREALRHAPRHALARARLATLLRDRLPAQDLAALRELLADRGLADGSRAALLFGLAQVLDARGEFAEAALALRQANGLALADRTRRGQHYDPSAHSDLVSGIIAACSREFFARVRGLGLESERPVFIVGLPRSGTTLTEQILASHPQAFGAGELRLARDDFEALAGGATGAAVDGRALEGLARLDRETARRVGERHLEQLGARNIDRVRIVDKAPENYLYIGLLAALFPRARFVHCRRDLRDVAVSCWMTNFRHTPWANDPEHIAARFHDYRRIMAHWERVLPVPLLALDYEETVADLEGVARRLVAWCGLAWDPACLAFHVGKRPVVTASTSQVRQPIYSRSVGRWQHYEGSLRPLFARLEAA
jgi:tetratricopeptide (TPR) repeat protein